MPYLPSLFMLGNLWGVNIGSLFLFFPRWSLFKTNAPLSLDSTISLSPKYDRSIELSKTTLIALKSGSRNELSSLSESFIEQAQLTVLCDLSYFGKSLELISESAIKRLTGEAPDKTGDIDKCRYILLFPSSIEINPGLHIEMELVYIGSKFSIII